MINDGVLNFLSYMPNPDDVLSGSWKSYSVYREMRTDPRIKDLLGKIKNMALNFPSNILQGESSDKVYALVKSAPVFKNLYKKQKRMLSALDYGFSVTEVVWQLENGIYLPQSLITRKPERFVFNSNWELFLNDSLNGMTRLNQDYKWLIYQHDPDDENPYGTSLLRCVYWPYMFKQAGYDFWLQATEKFSVKTLIALFTADGDEATVESRAGEIARMLMDVQSGSTAAVGNVNTIQEVGMAGNLSHFKELVECCDTQISYGLTGQAIATNATNGGSLALGQVQADLMYEDCKGIALELQGLMQKLIDWTVELNFGKGEKAPQFVFNLDHRASFDEVIQAIDRGLPVSRSAMYDYYSLPKPTGEDDIFVKPLQTGDQTLALQLADSSKKKLYPATPHIKFTR